MPEWMGGKSARRVPDAEEEAEGEGDVEEEDAEDEGDAEEEDAYEDEGNAEEDRAAEDADGGIPAAESLSRNCGSASFAHSAWVDARMGHLRTASWTRQSLPNESQDHRHPLSRLQSCTSHSGASACANKDSRADALRGTCPRTSSSLLESSVRHNHLAASSMTRSTNPHHFK